MFWKTAMLALFVVGISADSFTDLTNIAIKKKELLTFLRGICVVFKADDKVDDVVAAGNVFHDCINGLVDTEQLKKEIEEAKPKGVLNEVFHKYCAKTPQFKACFNTLLDAIQPCLDDSAKERLPSVKNGTDRFIDFVCYENGDRIALFNAENGPECVAAKDSVIAECAIKARPATFEVAKNLSVVERCTRYDELSTCVVKAFEGCQSPAIANLADSMLKFVRNMTACNDEQPKN